MWARHRKPGTHLQRRRDEIKEKKTRFRKADYDRSLSRLLSTRLIDGRIARGCGGALYAAVGPWVELVGNLVHCKMMVDGGNHVSNAAYHVREYEKLEQEPEDAQDQAG